LLLPLLVKMATASSAQKLAATIAKEQHVTAARGWQHHSLLMLMVLLKGAGQRLLAACGQAAAQVVKQSRTALLQPRNLKEAAVQQQQQQPMQLGRLAQVARCSSRWSGRLAGSASSVLLRTGTLRLTTKQQAAATTGQHSKPTSPAAAAAAAATAAVNPAVIAVQIQTALRMAAGYIQMLRSTRCLVEELHPQVLLVVLGVRIGPQILQLLLLLLLSVPGCQV
jgi:hypothetical protein